MRHDKPDHMIHKMGMNKMSTHVFCTDLIVECIGSNDTGLLGLARKGKVLRLVAQCAEKGNNERIWWGEGLRLACGDQRDSTRDHRSEVQTEIPDEKYRESMKASLYTDNN